MRDDEFEWDDAKAAANLAAHGVTFETARLSSTIPLLSTSAIAAKTMARIVSPCSEWLTSGCLHVAYTMRDDRIRIISARGAEPR